MALLPEDSLARRARAGRALGLALYRLGEYAEAWSAFASASEAGKQGGDLLSAIDCLGYMGRILWHRGQLHRMADIAQQGITLAGQSPGGALGRQRLGQAQYEWNELDKAALNQVLSAELAELRAAPDFGVTFNMFLARTRIAQGDSKRAIDAIGAADRVLEHQTVQPGIQAMATGYHALLALMMDNLPEALKWEARLVALGRCLAN